MHDEDEDYVNRECPSRCSLDHEVPDVTDWENGEYVCPATGIRYGHCTMRRCGTFELTPYDRMYGYEVRRGADDEWYCEDHYSDRFDACDNCRVVIWREDAHYDLDYCYCESCAPEEDAREFYGAPEPRLTCNVCQTQNLHMVLVTERFVCDHVALAMEASGHVIHFAHEVKSRQLVLAGVA